jgi:hypothetical protein
MDNCVKIFEKNLDDFIKISINDRYKIIQNEDINLKCGILFIDFNKNIDNVTFIPLDKYIFETKLLEMYPNFFSNSENISKFYDYYYNKYLELPKSFIYFSLLYNNENLNIEIDLDKNDSYSKHIIKTMADDN